MAFHSFMGYVCGIDDKSCDISRQQHGSRAIEAFLLWKFSIFFLPSWGKLTPGTTCYSPSMPLNISERPLRKWVRKCMATLQKKEGR